MPQIPRRLIDAIQDDWLTTLAIRRLRGGTGEAARAFCCSSNCRDVLLVAPYLSPTVILESDLRTPRIDGRAQTARHIARVVAAQAARGRQSTRCEMVRVGGEPACLLYTPILNPPYQLIRLTVAGGMIERITCKVMSSPEGIERSGRYPPET